MKKIILCLIAFQIFSSCQKSRLENLLLSADKRWVYIDSGQVKNKAIVRDYIKFFSNGDCENRNILNDENSFFSIEGNEKNNSWNYSDNDSILTIYDHRFKVLKYESDTIHVLQIKENWIKMLVNYKQNSIE
ncbi:hypothetical protein [Flavobacterium sp. 3HN19-14]|uniref:hypothetical protein n=1 Tax=Flavobacterium sp. 3HN19-14 TaxID=3448133 RepID=UPI003EE0999D